MADEIPSHRVVTAVPASAVTTYSTQEAAEAAAAAATLPDGFVNSVHEMTPGFWAIRLEPARTFAARDDAEAAAAELTAGEGERAEAYPLRDGRWSIRVRAMTEAERPVDVPDEPAPAMPHVGEIIPPVEPGITAGTGTGDDAARTMGDPVGAEGISVAGAAAAYVPGRNAVVSIKKEVTSGLAEGDPAEHPLD